MKVLLVSGGYWLLKHIMTRITIKFRKCVGRIYVEVFVQCNLVLEILFNAFCCGSVYSNEYASEYYRGP